MKRLGKIGILLLSAAFVSAGTMAAFAGMSRKIDLTAHRGDQTSAPENTLPAFEAAISRGAGWAEADIQQTKDGVLVVLHDENLKRLAGVDKNVWDLSHEELEALDIGSRYSPEFAGTRVPTLEQVIDVCRNRLKLNLEIKYSGHESQDYVAKILQIIDQKGMRDQCIFTSFCYDYVKQVKAVAPDIQAGLITDNAAVDFSDYPEADLFSLKYTLINKDVVSKIHHMGKKVHVWTVNAYPDIKNCIDSGVDNIITDNSSYVKQIIRTNLNE